MGFFSSGITLSAAELASRQAADAARVLASAPAQPDAPVVSEGSLKTEGTTTTYGQSVGTLAFLPVVTDVTAGIDTLEPIDKLIVSTTEEDGKLQEFGTAIVIEDGINITSGVVTVAGGAFPTTTDADELKEVQGTLTDQAAADILFKESMEKAQGIVHLTANDPVLKEFLLEAKRADLMIALKSQMSPDLEFNTLQVPEPDAKFVYQRWLNDETNLVSQEDPAKDPLLTEKLSRAPRYTELQWTMIGVTEQTTENKVVQNPEIQALKNAALLEPRGIGNSSGDTAQSVDKSLKTLNTFKSGTAKGRIVDIHDPLRGFAGISNKHEFGNSILTTIKFKSPTTIGSKSIFSLIRPK